MLVEKVELELKDWDFLDSVGACNIFMFLKEEEEEKKNPSHRCDHRHQGQQKEKLNVVDEVRFGRTD